MKQPDTAPPSDKAAEEAVIGSLLIDPLDALVRVQKTGLHPADFFQEALGTIYQAILALNKEGQGIDFLTVCDSLKRWGRLGQVGGSSALTRLINRTPTSVHAEHYASIVKRHALQRRLILFASDTAGLAHSHKGTSEELQSAQLSLWQTLGLARAITSVPFETLTADSILSTDWPEPRWIVPEILPPGLSILGGRPKVGKSWLALQIAQAVGAGGKALGYDVAKGKALVLALEDPPRRLKGRMRMQGWPMGLPVEFMPIGDFMDQVGDLRDGGGMRLARKIEAEGFTFCVVDTLSRSVNGDQNDVVEMTAALAPLAEIAARLNIAIMLIDHLRKMMGEHFDAVADILGSTAKAAVPDTLWALYRRKGQAGSVLAVTGRDVIPLQLELTFDQMTGCWQAQGQVGSLKITRPRQAILDYLADVREGQVGDIADAIDQNKGMTHRELQSLVAAHLVMRQNDGPRCVMYTLSVSGGVSE